MRIDPRLDGDGVIQNEGRMFRIRAVSVDRGSVTEEVPDYSDGIGKRDVPGVRHKFHSDWRGGAMLVIS